MSKPSIDTNNTRYREGHPLFFDLAFVREANSGARDLSDEQVWENILDARNASPFLPNVIFDVTFYAKKNADRLILGIKNPILHYLSEGEALGLDPNPYFDLSFYEHSLGGKPAAYGSLVEHALAHLDGPLAPFHPFIDADYCRKEAGSMDLKSFHEGLFQKHLNPLCPHPLFDSAFLMGHTPVRLQDAFEFYWDAETDLSTHPLFDPDYYKSQLADGGSIARSVYHYLITAAPVSPHPLFDSQAYSKQLYQQKNISVDRPYEHYLTQGLNLNIDPSPFFDAAFYREQSGCGPEALLDYVMNGYEKFAPHPMVQKSKARLFERSLVFDDGGNPNSREWQKKLPLQATPDFDHVFYANRKEHKKIPLEMRYDYLKDGYLKGERPNGLLSLKYITAQIPDAISRPDLAIQSYFRKGFQSRTRVLIAFQSLEDTPEMQAWLALIQSQISHPNLEFIVVAKCDGPLTQAFSKVSHIWHLGATTDENLTFEKLMQSGQRLREVMQGNPPGACFVQTSQSTDLARIFSQFNYPVTGFFSSGVGQVSHDDVAVLEHLQNGIFVPSEQEKSSLVAQGVTTSRIHVGLNSNVLPMITPEFRQSTRINTRAKLGVRDDEVLIVSDGNLDLEGGVDIFGAVLAQFTQLKEAPQNIKFLWHGRGRKFPNTPIFYARHFLRSVGVEDKFILTEEGLLEDHLCAGDIYLSIGRGGDISRGFVLAQAVGLAIISLKNHSEFEGADEVTGVISVDAFDLDTVVATLAELVSDAKLRSTVGTKIHAFSASDMTVERFVDRANAALKLVHPNLCPLIQNEKGNEKEVLIFMPSGVSKLLKAIDIKNPLDGVSSAHRKVIALQENEHVTVVTDIKKLTESFVDKFSRCLCFFSGTSREIQDIYRVGLYFDEIFVEDEQVVEEIEKMNPRIARKLQIVEFENE